MGGIEKGEHIFSPVLACLQNTRTELSAQQVSFRLSACQAFLEMSAPFEHPHHTDREGSSDEMLATE
jgi:hypothetical protein